MSNNHPNRTRAAQLRREAMERASMITIGNDGQAITATNYWHTEHALAGLCYLSGNDGAWRLLVPAQAEHMLPEMLTGLRVLIEPSISAAGAVDIVFEDGTDSPFALTLDRRQIDRKLEPGACVLSVWTEGKVREWSARIA